MNNKIYFVFFLTILCNIANGQILFNKTIGGADDDKANCVIQTLDGGYMIVGSTNSYGAGGLDVYAIKTDASGNIVWTKTYGGSADDVGNAVIQNPTGTYMIVGSTFSFGSGLQDVYVISIDGNGDTLWTRTYGGASLDVANDIKRTTDNNFVIVGSTNSFGDGDADVYLLKINGNGDTLWTKTYGGPFDESGNSINLTGAGGYVITGSTNSFGAGENDMYFITINDSGAIVNNTFTYGGPNGDEFGNCGFQTSDGGNILCGSTTSFGNGFDDIYIVKTDVSGTIQYQKTFGGASYDQGNGIEQTLDGGYVIVGTTQSFGGGNESIYLIKTDASLTVNWSKYIGGSSANQGNSVVQTSDGGYIVAGSTQSFGQGGWDVYIIKTDVNGYSGCDVSPATLLTTTPSTQITHALTVVSKGGFISMDSTIVSNGGIDGTICFEWEGIPRVTDNSGESFIYPNPSTGFTHLVLSASNLQDEVINLQLYDVLGKEINVHYSIEYRTSDSMELLIETNDIPQGVYFLKASIGQNIYTNIISTY